MPKSSIMAVISVFFMFFTLLIMCNAKLALIVSVFAWIGSAGYSFIIQVRENKRNKRSHQKERDF